MASCLIGIGSNLGDRAALVERALAALAQLPETQSVARSSVYETAPIGGPAAQFPYLNCAALLASELSPFALLDQLQRIEHELGRVRTEHWGSRTIDLDLLLYDELELASERLVVPHPRLAWRRFALKPAAEIAPDMLHPALQWSVGELLENLDRTETLVAVVGVPGGAASTLAAEAANRLQARYLHAEPCEPAGRSLPSHLKLLAGKREQMDRARWPAGDTCSISDFSLVELLVAASLSLADDELATYVAQWQAARASTIAAKLTVFVDDTVDPPEAHESARLAWYRDTLIAQLTRPGEGPLLTVEPANRADQVGEIVAAIQSMQ
ncbi:MAG: 2-amino-4-hydroxy-6-hydroxymethyldihydropteridine diphosphokinase [Pirellulales bacterium]|nr:2-amino-4-hydroxy-6-hydroxymethyldihydropteridine diphosphokinase [Pirellulales bacterium]